MNTAESELLKPPEAALFLRMSLSFVYKRVAAGAIPCLRIGRSIRFRREELADWMHSQKPEERE